MMGHGHATMGAATWLAIAGPLHVTVGSTTIPLSLDLFGFTPAQQVAGAVIVAGAALLPDADHHSGTIAHSLPPVSGVVTRAVGQVSGGHRHGTHSIIGALVAFALAWLLTPVRVPFAWTFSGWQINLPWGLPSWHFSGWALAEDFQIGAWIITVLMVAFAAKALRLTKGWLSSWSVALLAASVAVVAAPDDLWILPLMIMVGVFAHLLGDALTVQGIPLLWPLHPKPPKALTWLQHLVLVAPIWIVAGALAWMLLPSMAQTWDQPSEVWPMIASGAVHFLPVVIIGLCALAVTAYVEFSGGLDKGSMWKENGYFAWPILGTAGSGREWLFVIVLDVYLGLALFALLLPDFLTMALGVA